MNDWLPALAATLANGNPAVLLSVAHTVGSAPREAGATMLITAEYEAGSIGGGQLEWLAASAAHSLANVRKTREEMVEEVRRIAALR